MTKIAETPMMKQFNEIKSQHPDAVLLFRCGDFYQTFSADAIKASEILGITLTRLANGEASSVELAGFPSKAGHSSTTSRVDISTFQIVEDFWNSCNSIHLLTVYTKN